MQRLHQNDPTGHKLDKKKANTCHICIPGEIRNYGAMVRPPELRQYYVDDLMDPHRVPWSVLDDQMADLGQYGYAGQIGQNPTPPEGGMFQADRMTVLSAMPSAVHVVKTVRYWDKAGTEGGKGAYTAGVKMSLLTNGRWVIEDVKRGRWGTDERERIIRSVAETDGTRCQIWVEQEPGSGGKESAEGTIRNLGGFSVYAERPTGDKAFRADPFSVQVNNGNVMLLAGGMWHRDFVEELRFFPNSTYKDQTDAASGAFSHLTQKRFAQSLI
jgi:predicted phage terminase large subunit-like protein